MRSGIPLFAAAAALVVAALVGSATFEHMRTAVARAPGSSPPTEAAIDHRAGLGAERVDPPTREVVPIERIEESAPSPVDPTRILLTGRVLDLETGAPVSGLRVSIGSAGRRIGEEAVAAIDGRFELLGSEFWAGRLREMEFIEIRAVCSESGDARTHLSTTTRIRADRVARGEPIAVAVVRARAIEGRVLDAFGLPVRFAYLEVAPPPCVVWNALAREWERREGFDSEESVFLCDGERSVARTDFDGRFRLASLAPAGAHECVLLPIPTSPDCPRLAFDMSAAVVDERRDVDLVLPDPSSSIEGRVLVSGTPAPGVVRWRDRRLRGEISTDAEGHFRIVGVDPGSVEISARVRSGASSAIRSIEVEPGEREEIDLEISTANP